MKEKKLIEKGLWGIGIVITVIIFISFMFPDLVVTTKNGMMVWETLFSGRIREFYILNDNVYISNNFNMDSFAMYDFPVYIVFAIWDFPLWMYEKITHMYALDTFIGLLWAKSISIPFIVLIFFYMKKIFSLVTDEVYNSTSALYYITSAFFVVPVLIMGQYDAIGLLFIMIGLYEYIVGDTKKFVLSFSIAITFKMFALFVFVPLVLLKEKKFKSIVIQLLGGVSILFVFKLLQRIFFIPSVIAQSYATGHFVEFIFQNKVDLGYSKVATFFVFYVLFGLYCLFQKRPNEKEIGKWAIYISYVGLILFFVSSLTHPQWSLLLLPFSVLIISIYGKESFKVGAIVDTVGNVGLIIAQLYFYYWVFGVSASKYTLAGKLLYRVKMNDSQTVRGMLEAMFTRFNPDYFIYAGNAIFISCMIFMVFWSNPNTDRKKYENVEITVNTVIFVRIIVMVVLTLLMYGMFVC